MFNRNSGYKMPYMGVAPVPMVSPAVSPTMGVTPGAKVMGTFSGTVSPGYPPTAPYMPSAVSPAAVGPAPVAPVPVAPTNVLPPQVSPPQQFVNTNVMNTVVPHVHPSHTTTVNKHVYTHKHYFPHTQSCVNECYNQQVICGPQPMMPMHHCCPPRPFGF